MLKPTSDDLGEMGALGRGVLGHGVLGHGVLGGRCVPLLTVLISLALVATAVWSGWDDGGGYLASKLTVTIVLLALVPIGLITASMIGLGRCKPAPIVLIAGLVWAFSAFQCVGLESSWISKLSPGSFAAYSQWITDPARREAALSDLSPAIVDPGSFPVSIAPTYTRMALVGPVLFGLACWLASVAFVNRRVLLVVLISTAVAGGVFAFFGLADAVRLARDSEVELRQRLIISPVGADDPFGPFVNNNNAAGYLNLAIGCAIGLLSFCLGRDRSDAPNAEHDRRTYLDWRVIGCFLLVTVIAAGMVGSASRGGFVGMLAGTCVLAVTRLGGLPKIRVIVGSISAIVLVVLMLQGLGMSERSGDRLETIYQGDALGDPRLTHWQDSLLAAMHYLPAGAGLGTYRYAYLPYQHKGGQPWFVNADGMHVEWLVEGGIWLLPLVVLGLAFVARDVRRIAVQVASSEKPTGSATDGDARFGRAMVTVMTFVVPALIVSQCFDYGILQPPLLLTFAILCGGAAKMAESGEPLVAAKTGLLQAKDAATWCVFGLLVVGLVLASRDLGAGTIVQQAEQLRLQNRRVELLEVPSYEQEIDQVANLLKQRPHDSTAHRLLAQLLIDQQRRLGAQWLDENQATEPDNYSLWVSPRNVRLAYFMQPTENSLGIEQLMLPTQQISQWRRARAHALAALLLCPLDDTARVMLVELDMVEDDAREVTPDLLKQVALLRSRNELVLLECASLAEVYPAGETAATIAQMREELRQEYAEARLRTNQ